MPDFYNVSLTQTFEIGGKRKYRILGARQTAAATAAMQRLVREAGQRVLAAAQELDRAGDAEFGEAEPVLAGARVPALHHRPRRVAQARGDPSPTGRGVRDRDEGPERSRRAAVGHRRLRAHQATPV